MTNYKDPSRALRAITKAIALVNAFDPESIHNLRRAHLGLTIAMKKHKRETGYKSTRKKKTPQRILYDELNGKNGRRAALIHYTYSNDFDPEGTFTPAVIGKWHFDKRDYIVRYLMS